MEIRRAYSTIGFCEWTTSYKDLPQSQEEHNSYTVVMVTIRQASLSLISKQNTSEKFYRCLCNVDVICHLIVNSKYLAHIGRKKGQQHYQLAVATAAEQ